MGRAERENSYMDAVIFDMDGVLFDTERMCMDAWSQVAKKRGIAGMDDVARSCIGLNANDTRKLVLSHYGEDFAYDDFRNAVSSWMNTRIKIYGLPVKPGVGRLLEYLKHKEIPVGLASSTGYASVLSHLKNAGIVDNFQVIITGDMIEHSKPSPDIYVLACRKLGAVPSRAYAIEDSPNGIRSAYSAGLKPILVPDMIEPDDEIRSKSFRIFDDLIQVMRFFQEIA